MVINQLASNGNGKNGDEVNYDVVIAGAGVAGLSATFAAQEKALKCILLKQGEIANTIGIFPAGKIIYG